MLLLDKGYFDYDYEKVEAQKEIVNWEDTLKSDEEVADMMAMFGFGGCKKKPETTEEIQEYLMQNIKED